MAPARARLTHLLAAFLALLARNVHGSAAPADACASCRSLLSAAQRSLLDDGWAREQLLGACAAQPEAQVRRTGLRCSKCARLP